MLVPSLPPLNPCLHGIACCADGASVSANSHRPPGRRKLPVCQQPGRGNEPAKALCYERGDCLALRRFSFAAFHARLCGPSFRAYRNGVAARKPAMKIDVGAASRTERARCRSSRFSAYRAGPGQFRGFSFAVVFAKRRSGHGLHRASFGKAGYTLFSQATCTGKPSPASIDKVSRRGRPTTAE